MRVWWWAGLVGAIALSVGWQTRLATILLFVLIQSMMHRNLSVVHGQDLVFRMLLFYGLFAPFGACLSIDSRGSPGKSAGPPVIWPVRLMQLNFLFIYVNSVPHRLVSDEAWLNGEAVYWAMANNMWGRDWIPMIFYQHDAILSKVATYGTILTEGTVPILIWFRNTRMLAIMAGVLLHVCIAVLLANVAFFSLAMICGYCLFLPAPLVRRVLGLRLQ
jgi:hypothetical protein